MKAKLEIISQKAQIDLLRMTNRSKSLRGFLNRVTYQHYQRAQLKRWQTENESEGRRWKPLNPAYEAYKKIRYGGGPMYRTGKQGEGRWHMIGSWMKYPGEGRKKMIATGRLIGSVIGPIKAANAGDAQFGRLGLNDHRKLVTNQSLEVFTTVEYARDAGELRPFMMMGDKTTKAMLDEILDYMVKGELGGRK